MPCGHLGSIATLPLGSFTRDDGGRLGFIPASLSEYLRLLDDLGRADTLQLVPLGSALLIFGRNALVILSKE